MRTTDYTLSAAPRQAAEEALLSSLPRTTLLSLRQAGEDLIACYAELASARRNLLQEAIGEHAFTAGEHYPPEDAIDRRRCRHYFYHAHSAEDARGGECHGEHGHFHVFARLSGLRPQPQPWIERGISHPWRGDAELPAPDPLVHLIAVSMNAQGVPVGLFATNQWVTDETLCPAEETVRLLRVYRPGPQEKPTLLTRWLSALLRLYEPHVGALLRERDAVLRRWATRHRGRIPALHDRRLDICSSTGIAPDAWIHTIADLCSSR